MYLSSLAMAEPEDSVYLYAPSWINVWESHVYRKALKSTQAHGWGFKRFGTSSEIYAREMIRTPGYTEYIDAMEQVAGAALQQLSAKERMLLLKSRTAFIYADSWGESASFDNIASTLHAATIDTLPKNLLKKFSVKDFTCKIRGEKQSLVQAMKVAQDYLNWHVFDYVVICAAFRAVPILVFSEEDITAAKSEKNKVKDIKLNLSTERVGCFIFSRHQSDMEVDCGHYIMPSSSQVLRDELLGTDGDLDIISFSSLRKSVLERELMNKKNPYAVNTINLIDLYDASGCITPALSWIYLKQQDGFHGKMRTVVADNFGGYNYFDTRC